MGSVISIYVYYFWVDRLSAFIRWVVWCGRLMLVVSVAMYRCDLKYRLIKLHTCGCVGS